MLTHPTFDQLTELGLPGMAKAFKELIANPDSARLSPQDWLAVLVDHEQTARQDKRFQTRARAARLRHAAVVEDVDYHTPRGLDRALFQKLATCRWIHDHHNLILTGPTGTGKSWLACALGHRACRENLSVLYQRLPRLFETLALAHGDGRYPRLMKSLAKVRLLILDDWGPEPLTAEQRRDLLEIVEDRYQAGSLLITSQVPLDTLHGRIGCPTLADAILDRLVHNAIRIDLHGDSLRRRRPLPEAPPG